MEYKWLHSKEQKKVGSVLAIVEGEKINSVIAYVIRQKNGSWDWYLQGFRPFPHYGNSQNRLLAMIDAQEAIIAAIKDKNEKFYPPIQIPTLPGIDGFPHG